jgi:DNA polymerase-3 subunit epsilon
MNASNSDTGADFDLFETYHNPLLQLVTPHQKIIMINIARNCADSKSSRPHIDPENYISDKFQTLSFNDNNRDRAPIQISNAPHSDNNISERISNAYPSINEKYSPQHMDVLRYLLSEAPIARPILQKYIFIFDVETTGLESDARIIECAFILCDSSGAELDRYSALIHHPDVATIKNTRIHGITSAMCRDRGIPIYNMLERLYGSLARANLVVGHNVQFDIRRLKYESRIVFPRICELLDEIPAHCTMRHHTIKKDKKLTTLHAKLTNVDHDIKAHRALGDTIMCRDLYFAQVGRVLGSTS